MKESFDIFYNDCKIIARELKAEITHSEAERLYNSYNGGNADAFIRACIQRRKQGKKAEEDYKGKVREYLQDVKDGETVLILKNGEWLSGEVYRFERGRIIIEFENDGFRWVLSEYLINEKIKNNEIKLV